MFGLNLVERCNAIFMALLGLTFAILLVNCSQGIQTSRLSFTNWGFLPSALPIIVTTFCFQNIIPTVAKSLNHKKKPIFLALLIGTLIPLAMNAIWILDVSGALPVKGAGSYNLLHAFHHGQPAIVPLAGMLHSKTVTLAGMFFSILALITSYVAVNVALAGFLADLLRDTPLGKNQNATKLLAAIPPLAVAIIYPELFLTALDVVGGLAIVLLFGILPGFVLLKKYRHVSYLKYAAGWGIIILFASFLCLELFQEMGWLLIKPESEHWVFHFPRL